MQFEVKEPFREVEWNFREREYRYEHQKWLDIAKFNRDTIYSCDCMFAIVDGCPPDAGVMHEIGMAQAWDLPVFLYRMDQRYASDVFDIPINLMVLSGFDRMDDFYLNFYYDIDHLRSPNKGLMLYLDQIRKIHQESACTTD